MNGSLYIIAAPSGAGKTSLVRAVLAGNENLQRSISYTTRPIRPGEQDGVDYRFVDDATFQTLIEQDAFLEYAQVFGHYYGTARKWVKQSLESDIDVVLEIDWQGARQIKEKFPASVSIFILPPSIEILEARLQKRGQDGNEVIAGRMKAAQEEISHYNEFNYLLVNDDFDQAVVDIQAIVHSRRLRIERQETVLSSVIKQLLNK